MATKKTKGEWKSETLKEWKPSKSVTWRAQRSTAPDGKEFIGVRQYIMTGKSGELAGRSGITVLVDENAASSLLQIVGLFEAVAHSLLKDQAPAVQGRVKATLQADKTAPVKKLGKKAQAEKDEADAKDAHAAKADYVLVRDGNIYMARCRTVDGVVKVKSTEDSDDAQIFKLPQAKKVLEKVSSRWAMQEL